eukprot:TRINITY_DN1310_c0_g1_i1.p1 TRINITY_DN1310_c0_g1~~TRINITY_DN1310_c0_g1_i1.p1  ORF type:complete len:349 (+),score=126.14 TRINITY_DN1310_c0_g1_i1:75-1121(+)
MCVDTARENERVKMITETDIEEEDGVFKFIGLRYKCDRRVLLWVAIYHVLTYATWTHWYSLGWAARAGMLFACSMFSFFGATITHNAIHVPLFSTPYANSFFQIALSHTYGWPVSALVPGHNLSHHKFTNTARDAMRPDRMRYSWNFLNYLMFPVETARAIAASDKAYMMHQKEQDRPIWRQYLVEAASFYPLQAMLALYSWDRYLAIVLLPQLYAKYQIIAMNILQHDGCPAHEIDDYNHSRNFTGAAINYLTFNNGYHTIHHTNPGWHWKRLPSSHDALLKPKMHPGCDQDNILTYFFRAHIYPGKRLAYDGTPYVLPDEIPDEKWYDGTAETYSEGVADYKFKNE